MSELRRHLAERLPPPMMPVALRPARRVAAQPEPEGGSRCPAGAPDGARPALDQAYVAPEDPTQSELVRIWEELLEVSPIGIRDDFFDLGGDSLLATAMLAAIEEALGVEASPSVLLSGTTIEHVAAGLYAPMADPEVVPIQPGGSRPPLYFLHGDYLGRGMYAAGSPAPWGRSSRSSR